MDCRLVRCVCRNLIHVGGVRRIGYPGGMIALILFVLGILASPFKAKSRLEAECSAPAAVDCFAAQGEESAEAGEHRPLVSRPALRLMGWSSMPVAIQEVAVQKGLIPYLNPRPEEDTA